VNAPAPRPWPHLVAAAVCALQGLLLVGFCGFYLYELVLGEGDDAGRVVMSVVLMGSFAVALLAMARGWVRALPWPRTPTILWNLLLLPVAWSMWGAGFWGAVPLAVAALLAIAAGFSARGEVTPSA
jgi:hypothetical protein